MKAAVDTDGIVEQVVGEQHPQGEGVGVGSRFGGRGERTGGGRSAS